ncbi:MAG: hypothetical protein J1F09_07915, partial [Oscillospiraceae bacterium]|nr:hypothetical protein [Oscillospiraceae bacterium]
RTSDLPLRRRSLYPAELQRHTSNYTIKRKKIQAQKRFLYKIAKKFPENLQKFYPFLAKAPQLS